jgi:DNA-binding transcriptional LysR family regulator
MAKAAHRLAVSQPAVSKSIADLEHTLKVRLLDRGPQGVEPTLYGRTLVRRGLAVFDELRQGVGEIEFLASSTAGEVRFGCNESLSAALLPAVIELLHVEHPGVTVHVAQMSRPIAVEVRALRERNVDLIIARGEFSVPEDDVESDVLFTEPFIVVASVRSRWARRRKLQLAELLDEKWILYPPEEAPGALVHQAFRDRGLAVPRATHCHDVVSLARHIADDWGVFDGNSRLYAPRLKCEAADDQTFADRSWRANETGGDLHLEEPHVKPRRRALHRVRPIGDTVYVFAAHWQVGSTLCAIGPEQMAPLLPSNASRPRHRRSNDHFGVRNAPNGFGCRPTPKI